MSLSFYSLNEPFVFWYISCYQTDSLLATFHSFDQAVIQLVWLVTAFTYKTIYHKLMKGSIFLPENKACQLFHSDCSNTALCVYSAYVCLLGELSKKCK